MKLKNLFNEGACGIEQALYAGKVAFDTGDIDAGIALVEVPANHVITRAVCIVKTAFNAVTTNVLTLGTDASVIDLLGATAVTEGTPGTYQAQTWIETGSAKKTVKAKFTESGAAATTGTAEFYIFVMRLPE